VADASYLQMKMLNTNKGPAVQSLRAQVDKVKYPVVMQELLLKQDGLDIIEDSVIGLVTTNQQVTGVKTKKGRIIETKACIITSGTYLRSKTMVSSDVKDSGPDGLEGIDGLSQDLQSLGFELIRLKTGTPARIRKDSIDYQKVSLEPGSIQEYAFSDLTNNYIPFSEQWPCYLTYTNEKTHEIVEANLDKSSMYSGVVTGVGARYCPSIEDKVVRFSDKKSHQIFLEPESAQLDSIYIQGLSSSLPYDVQKEMIHSIAGLENADIIRYGYAIEYDAINPIQLYPTLESKNVTNLYFAGQINGTSGYEEAAGQGLMAGINASLKLKGAKPLILKRNEAYIGVMIDDLVTKGTKEPYRLLTSRAEYRLLLRSDNAALRLTQIGYDINLVTKERYDRFINIKDQISSLKDLLNDHRFKPKDPINEGLIKIGSSPLFEGVSALDLLKRPEVKISLLLEYLNVDSNLYQQKALNQVEIEVKYQGYIKKALNQAAKFIELEDKTIPSNIDYQKVSNLASEALQKLSAIRPLSIGQATRISGVNPSDIQNLLIYLKQVKTNG
ncbi:MAG: tRNA uridine-5-carboxymethylaminomethyl(34) synthesis enzyme MnmG, partial [Bacilli bacterium]